MIRFKFFLRRFGMIYLLKIMSPLKTHIYCNYLFYFCPTLLHCDLPTLLLSCLRSRCACMDERFSPQVMKTTKERCVPTRVYVCVVRLHVPKEAKMRSQQNTQNQRTRGTARIHAGTMG